MPPLDEAGAPSLSDLRRAQPADATLSNLLEALCAKLRLCSRLTVSEYEASREGHTSSAAAFRALADEEGRSFEALVRSLRSYLDEAASREAGAPGDDPA